MCLCNNNPFKKEVIGLKESNKVYMVLLDDEKTRNEIINSKIN